MSPSPGQPAAPAAAAETLHHRLKSGLLWLAALNGLSTAYYINYIFFYMEKKFGVSKADNLLLAAFYGFTYMFAAYSYGGLAHKHGYFSLLRAGMLGMTGALAAGFLLPLAFGHAHPTIYGQFAVLIAWAISTSLTWPTLQALLSRESPGELPRLVGIYNLLWAGGGAVAQFTGGAFFDHLGGEFLFWLPVAINVVQLILTSRLHGISDTVKSPPAAEPAPAQTAAPAPNPRATEKSRAFLRLAWAANPFCYIAVYGFLPLIPQLSGRLHLTMTATGVVFSVWFWSRLAAFYLFSHWDGWHYKFRWLLAAYLAMIASFVVILVSPNLPMLVGAQLIFGLAVGLIYSSSLYYSMDVGASKSKRGGFHEAVIGFGIGAGPAIGFGAIRLFPAHPNAVAWNVGGALVIGLLLFLAIHLRWRHDKTS